MIPTVLPIISNGQQQEKTNGRMAGTKQQPRDKPGKCDIGRRWNSPAASPFDLANHGVQSDKHRDRTEYAADRSQQRIDRFGRWIQRSSWQAGLGNLLGGDAKEEDHKISLTIKASAQGLCPWAGSSG